MADDETLDASGAIPIPRIGDDPLRIVDESGLLGDNNNNNTASTFNNSGGTDNPRRQHETEPMSLGGLEPNDVDVANLYKMAAEQHAQDEIDDEEDDDDEGEEEGVRPGEDGQLEFTGRASRSKKNSENKGLFINDGGDFHDDLGEDGAERDEIESEDDDDDDEQPLDDDEDEDEDAATSGDDDNDDDDADEQKGTGDAAAAAAAKKPKKWKAAFPENTVKKLLQIVAPPSTVFTKDALKAVNRAVELILQDLAEECAKMAKRRGTKQLTYDMMAEVISHHDRFSFLTDVIPLPTSGKLVQLTSTKKKTSAADKTDAKSGGGGAVAAASSATGMVKKKIGIDKDFFAPRKPAAVPAAAVQKPDAEKSEKSNAEPISVDDD